MANQLFTPNHLSGKRPPYVQLDTTGVWSLGNASDSLVGSMMLQVAVVSGTGWSLTIRTKVTGSAVANASADVTGYENPPTGTTFIAGSTPITAAGRYKVYCDMADVILDYTAGTAGIITVEYRPEAG